MRSFRSDNNSGLCPEALEALIEANDGSHQIGYGDDTFTDEAVAAFREVFGPETAVFFVATGTAGNVLAIAALTEPWDRVLCHEVSHYNEDESTAPERIAHCRAVQIHTPVGTSKVTAEMLRHAAGQSRGDVHEPQPGVLTISNATEMGEVYGPEEMRELCTVAQELGYRVHVDGARFANAVAAVGCDPRALANDAGVDTLVFGGTKNGLACSEAVLFFPQGDGSAYERAVRAFPFHRKGTGHLLSKHRFISAPFTAALRGGVWLKHAAHANAMARELSSGLVELGLEPAFPTQANAVFVDLPEAVHEALQAAGHAYYASRGPGPRQCRLMVGFDTRPEDVRRLLDDARATLLR